MANSTYTPQKDQLSTTAVTPGTYTNPSITVNATGQITAASSGTASPGLPLGGTTSQVLSKIDNTDYNTQWVTIAGGGNMNTATYDAAAIAQQVVGLTATQTLTNKTLTAPVIATITNTGTLTLPTVTGTIALTTSNISGTAANVTGTVAFANGGTGATSQLAAINATNPHTTLGDISYRDVTNVQRLAGNITAVKQFLTQTGTGTVSAAPAWGAIAAGDVPTLNQNTSGTAANITGVAAAANGGTGQSSYAIGDLLYASAATTISKLADVAVGSVLISGGVATAPSWGKVAMASAVSGILPVANGGIGVGTITGIMKGTGTTAVVAATAGTDYSAGTSALATGILKSTTATGALTIAIASDFPTLNQSTTGNAATATTASGLTSATTTVSVSAATAPTAGQVLTATSGTVATWQTPSGGANGISSATANGAVYATGATTVTSTAALTNGQLLIGSTGAVPVAGTLTAGTNILITNAAGSITVAITGSVGFVNGGTGATTSQGAINATNPHTTLGDISYRDASNVSRLAGNTTAAKNFLTQTGTGTVSAAPAWGTIAAGDVPTLNQNTTGKAAAADAINSATTTVNVAAATAPTTGQVLTATDSTHATWQTASGGAPGNPATFQIGTYTTGTSLGQQACYVLYVAQAAQTINKLQFYCNVSQNSSVVGVSMYSAALAQLGGGGTVTLTATAGFYTASFASGVSVTAGTTYYLAIVNQTNETVTRFASMNAANDVATVSVVNSTSALPTTMPSAGSRSSAGTVPFLMPLT